MADNTENEQPENGGKQNKTLIMIIVGVIAFLLITIILAVYFMLGSSSESTQNEAATKAPVNSQAPSGGTTRSGGNYLSIGPIYALDQFIVNLQNGRRYLKVSIHVEMSQATLSTELDSKRVAIRDTILSILSSKSLEEVSTAKGKEKLKEEIADRMNEFLVDGKVVNVFLTEFVIQ